MREVSIASTARILPEAVITNEEIGERLIANFEVKDSFDADAVAQVRTRSQLIEKKTGLRARRFFSPETMPVDVGFDLLTKLMKPSGAWGTLDGLIVSSSSSHGFPGLSQQIIARAKELHPEIGNPFVLDVGSNACTGFMYALTIGASLIKAMEYRRVACIAIEFSSRCISYEPQAFGTSTLFGDATAGVLLQGGGGGVATINALRASSMIDVEQINLIKGGGMDVARPELPVSESARWYMAGPPVAVGATRILVSEIQSYQRNGAKIDWLLPHQANLTRILIPACKNTGIDPSRLRASFAETGNTSSASIPILLDELVRLPEAETGQTALLIGFGASFTLGSALLTLNDVPVSE